jgi:hypothetical protein
MDHDEAATTLDVVDERLAHLIRPQLAVVVADHDVVLRELRAPLAPVTVSLLGRRRGDRHLEESRLLERLLVDRSHLVPVVVVLPIDDEDADLLGLKPRSDEQTDEQRGKEEQT